MKILQEYIGDISRLRRSTSISLDTYLNDDLSVESRELKNSWML